MIKAREKKSFSRSSHRGTSTNNLMLRRRQTPSSRTGLKAPLSIHPEQTPGFRPGKVEGVISSSAKNAYLIEMKHQKIVDGASRVLFKKGYHLTTIRDIAKACNMSMGQLYHYISSKDDILFLVHKHMQKIWYDHLESFGVEKIEDPRQKLLSVLRHTLEFMVENKDLIQFVYSESKHLDKKHLRIILEMDDQNVVGYYRRLLKDINKHKSLKEDLNLCANLIAYLNVFLALRGWNLKKIPTQATTKFLIDFVLRGIGLTP